MSSLKIHRSWLARKRPTSASELDATFCRLEVLINDQPITEYVTPERIREAHLEVPSYYLAEWIAENWWALLNEPRKSDERGDDPGFLARHSLVAAQHGFPLPSLLVVPVGKDIHLFAAPRTVPFADVKFVKGASAFVRRSEVESELAGLVDNTLTRLREWQISGTPLEAAWMLIRGTSPEEEQFCRMVGALGLSPYDLREEIANTIEAMFTRLGERELRDLCLASTAENFVSSAGAAVGATDAMASSPTIELQPLSAIQLPPENPDLPGWRRGVQAANRVRAKLGINETDPHGGDAIFEKLKIDTINSLYHPNSSAADVALAGAVAKHLCRRSVLGDHQIRPPILVKVRDRSATLLAINFDPGFLAGHGL